VSDEAAVDTNDTERGGERPVYMARTLADAQRLEAVFTAAGIEYDVEPDTYQGGIIFRTSRVGAFFYVAPETWERATAVMKENGFRPAKP
jgi:hypothetical protein